MRSLSPLRWLVLAILVLGLSGCAATQSRSEYPAVEAGSRLDLEYPIENRMEMVSLTIRRDGSLPTVMISGEGTRSRTAVEWSAQWFTPDGREITGTSNRFRRATINPDVAFTLQATAPVPEADTVHVRIRQSDNM